jgi:hypothetical protein
MAQKEISCFFNAIQNGKTEEDVKDSNAKFFNIQYDITSRHDLYTLQVLFEFKFDKNFRKLKSCS